MWAGKITLANLKPLENVKEYASKLYKLFLKKAEALEVSSFLEIYNCFLQVLNDRFLRFIANLLKIILLYFGSASLTQHSHAIENLDRILSLLIFLFISILLKWLFYRFYCCVNILFLFCPQ